jgi:hypothetical protein
VKPPKCPLCKAHHWSSEPHVFEDEPVNSVTPVTNARTVTNAPPSRAVTPSKAVEDTVNVLSPAERHARWRAKRGDRYKISQRDLMRERRAKARASVG